MSDTVKKFIKEYLPYVIVIILVLLFKNFVFAPVKVNGTSMDNTLKDKQILLLNIIDYKLHNNIKRFDIVVIDTDEEFLIKRIIGLPGDIVSYLDNKLYINGKYVENDYANGDTSDFEVKVPKGEYFVLGDNREVSLDSRFFGAFERNKIKGRTDFIIYPFSKFGRIEK